MATTEIRSNSIRLAYQCNKQTNKQTNKHAFLFVNSLGYGNSEAAKRCRRIGRDLRQFVRSFCFHAEIVVSFHRHGKSNWLCNCPEWYAVTWQASSQRYAILVGLGLLQCCSLLQSDGKLYVVGSKSFRPDQLFKETEIKQLRYFST